MLGALTVCHARPTDFTDALSWNYLRALESWHNGYRCLQLGVNPSLKLGGNWPEDTQPQ